jgi:TolB-like protein
MTEHETEVVRGHLDKILASEGFVNAERLRRFLRFTVEARLSGEHEQIKEYLLGREVFDRDDRYDPRMDPIVRVEARRLRSRLEEYYGRAGVDDAIRIELPKGSYVPLIRQAGEEGAAKGTSSRRQFARWAVGGMSLLLAALAAVAFFPGAPGSNRVAVVPASWLWGDTTGLDPLDSSLAEILGAEIANRRAASVIAWPLILPYRDARKKTRDLAAELGAARILTVAVRGGDRGAARVTIFLMSAVSGEKIWVSDYPVADLSSIEAQRALARRIAAEFAAREREKRGG